MEYKDLEDYFNSRQHKEWQKRAGITEDKRDLYIFNPPKEIKEENAKCN